MGIAEELAARGYFPKELPPTFSTATFAAYVGAASDLKNLQDQKLVTQTCPHSLARIGFARRSLGLPNPVAFGGLCATLELDWQHVDPKCAGNKLAATAPVRTSKKVRAFLPSRSPALVKYLRAATRTGGRYLAKTDISQFYHTVYTHSIPWALHTKTTAKAKRYYKQLAGNRIDTYCRNAQDGQTMGIPVGPDTSLILSECLMQRVDDVLLAKFPGVSGFRYIDDYELTCESVSQAEDVLHTIDTELSRFELKLNPKKTAVVQLPQSLEERWTVELRQLFPQSSKSKPQLDQLLAYFGRAFELTAEYPEDAVLPYAISSVRNLALSDVGWRYLQRLFVQAMNVEPASIYQVVARVAGFVEGGHHPDRSFLGDALNRVISRHAPQRHSSEVAWAIWALLALNEPVAAEAAQAMASFDDSVVALLGLDAQCRGLNPHLNPQNWAMLMHAGELVGPHWLIAYEAYVQGWLPSLDGTDYIGANKHFDAMRSAGVRFYQPSGANLHVPASALALPSGTSSISIP